MSGSKSSDASSPGPASLPPDLPAPAHAGHLLGLTVHSVPEAGAAVDLAQRTRHRRYKMLALLLGCATPVIASHVTYYLIPPEGHPNYGECSDPQRSIPELAATALDA